MHLKLWIPVTLVVVGLGLSCTQGNKTSNNQQGAPVRREPVSLSQAQRLLGAQDQATRDSAEDAAFLSVFVDSLARAKGPESCSCNPNGAVGSPGDDPVLGLDGTEAQHTQVAKACDLVGQLATKSVEGDGGCWFRANAVCLAGLAQGLPMGKVWILGDVRDVFGGLWNFHVANTYDGKVYDAGFGMMGVSLDEWQKKFSGDVAQTQLVVSTCSSFYNEGVTESPTYTEPAVKQICEAAQAFGGDFMQSEVSQWLKAAAPWRERAGDPAFVVTRGSQCGDASSIGSSRPGPEGTWSAPEIGPAFTDDHWVSGACQGKVYEKALERVVAATMPQTLPRFEGVTIRRLGQFAASLAFRFEDPSDYLAEHTVRVIIDGQCRVRAMF